MSHVTTRENLVVSCSWGSLNERLVEDAVILNVGTLNQEKKNVESMVSPEMCVNLGEQNTSAPCIIEIKLTNKEMKVTEFQVVSEARIIEVYGKCGEYVATCHSEFLDEYEGLFVYTTEFKLPNPSSEFSLKFARMKKKGQMWLYGMYVSAEKDATSCESSIMSVNFQNVNKILKESNHQLTEKADKCKKFLQMYSLYRDSKESQMLSNSQALFKMLDAMYVARESSIGVQTKSVNRYLSDIFPDLNALPKSNEKGNFVSVSRDSVLPESEDDYKYITHEIKQHIDRQFREFAISLMSVVDEKLSKIEKQHTEKLDKIIMLVESMKQT